MQVNISVERVLAQLSSLLFDEKNIETYLDIIELCGITNKHKKQVEKIVKKMSPTQKVTLVA